MRIFKIIFSYLSLILLFGCSENKVEETTIYLVRHAEKDTTVEHDNPPLIVTGKARAEKLARELKDEDITYIFSTKYDRNKNTVLPLSLSKDLNIDIYNWNKWQPMIDSLKTISGTHVICGHGDNLLPMIDELGGKVKIKSLGHNEYDKMFKVNIKKDTVKTETIVY
ncbi:MAG: histidine phosphatase family protein [Brumimicrobium sp.]